MAGLPSLFNTRVHDIRFAQPSNFVFEMHRGVLRVWTDASKTVEVGRLPGNDYDFFSDMQRRELKSFANEAVALYLALRAFAA